MSPVGLYDAPELDEAGNREIARDYLAHLCTGEDPTSSSGAIRRSDFRLSMQPGQKLSYGET